MNIGKIYLRSIIGIITMGIVTVLIAERVDINVLVAFYGAVGLAIYVDKDVSAPYTKP